MPIDVLIRGARVVDGTGNPWFYADVALEDDRIAAILPPGSADADAAIETVDARGMVVCPGFIDIQSHSILPLMIDRRCLSKVTQGVTTEIMGESWTPAPAGGRADHEIFSWDEPEQLREWRDKVKSWTHFRDWLETMVQRGVTPNIGSYLGGGTLRSYAKGLDQGPANPEELDTMRRVMREAMEDGAFGVSYALIYPPDAFVGTDELVEVCKVVAQHGGAYITHMRSEADEFLEGLEETLEIGKRAGVAVEIYHLKVSGKANWPKMQTAIARIDRARFEGQDVTADMYPYIAGGTGLSSVFPPWLAAEGKFYENLRDPATRAGVKEQVQNPTGGWEALGTLAGPGGIYPLDLNKPENKQYIGHSLAEIAEMRGEDWIETAAELLVSEEQRIGTVYFMMSEENLCLQLRQPWIKISTDAGGVDPAWAKPLGPTHPRSYGTYTRVLGKYVREEHVITLEDAVRKMTSAVTKRLGIGDRGLLQPGCYADVVIFDPETVADHATFEDSHRLSTGIRDVWINGARVLSGGEHTGKTPGRVLRGPGWKG
ncbi:MAG: N-acyl-D-amino-acid deacylase family protein [Chloroflexota bacterium]